VTRDVACAQGLTVLFLSARADLWVSRSTLLGLCSLVMLYFVICVRFAVALSQTVHLPVLPGVDGLRQLYNF
jgi:hypothetical protein